MASQSLTKFPISSNSHYFTKSKTQFSLNSSTHLQHNSWVSGTSTKVLIQSSSSPSNFCIRPFAPNRHRSVNATTITFSLPTASKERVYSVEEKVPKWSSKAIKSFAMGELEARKLKCANTGTESILMGILIEGTNFAAKFLRQNGVTLFKVREETAKLLGKADMYFFSPEHPPITESAQRVLDKAVDKKLKAGQSSEITPTDLLLGIWAESESPGHKILVSLGFTSEKVEELKSIVSEPGFVDD